MRAVLVVVLLAALACAGCLGEKKADVDDVDETDPASGSGSKTGSGSKSGSGAPKPGFGVPNRPPAANLSADVLAGAAPLAVNFTLDGTDADGDELAWTLSFGDNTSANGTGLPANATHAFAAGGNYTVSFVVSDGRLNATGNLTIAVTGDALAANVTAVFTEQQSFPSDPVNSQMVPQVGYAGGTGCVGYWAGESGGDCVFFELDAAWAGKGFTATADAGNPDLEFWPVCDPKEVFAVAGFAADGPEAGVIPDGALCVVIWNGEASFDTPTHTFTVL